MSSWLDEVDKLLGDLGKVLMAPPRHKPNPFESRATATAKTVEAAGQTFPSVRPVDVAGPFSEEVIPLAAIPGPPLGGAVVASPPTLMVSGERILLKANGTPPSVKLSVSLGGRLYFMQPGAEIVAPFTRVQLINRLTAIPDDIGNGNATGFQGELQLLVSKSGAALQPPGSWIGTPYFRPVSIFGDVADANDSAHWLGPLGDTSGMLQSALCGAQKMRIYFSQKNFPGGSTATVVSGDALTCRIYESPLTYSVDGTAVAFPFLGITKAPRISAKDINFTWGSEQCYAVDVVFSSGTDLIGINLTIANGHTLYLAAQGIP